MVKYLKIGVGDEQTKRSSSNRSGEARGKGNSGAMTEAELEAQQRPQKTHGIIVSRRESVVFLSVQPNNQSKPNSHKERRLDICNGEAEADGRSGGSSHEDEVEDGASFSDEADCRLNKAQLGEDNVHVGTRVTKQTPWGTGYKEEDDGFFMGHAAEVFKDEVGTDGLVDTGTAFRFHEDGRDVFHDFWVLISSSLAATMLLTYQQLHEPGSTLLLHLLRQTGQLSPPLLHAAESRFSGRSGVDIPVGGSRSAKTTPSKE
ncbi:hypothetical protein K435DRAFT_810374 [Dendrothele bispora CBS 962.96]|uniref:Uncharacterized protein n=1 Tax=Dendrothele bispora (strain CBS 962.96) TaxID=1314807 RepID=A0A4V4HBL2_DENBC|nr:hypothetical protein K435DRAFT_810374 [Dendrothele bispora CBS 962.96]